MRRRAASVAVGLAAIGAGLALALAADGQAPAEPALPPGARPEVPGAARTLVPFGIETTADGPRAWALGQSGGRTVVLQRAPRGGWSSTPLPVAGQPVGGTAPQHAGELTADGRGAVLLADPGQPDQDAQLLVRAPGATFAAAPSAGAVLAPGERLAANATRPEARALLAVIGGADAATLVAPTDGDGVASAVLRLDATGWHREAIAADGLGGPVHPVALAAAGPTRAWLLGTAGERVVLLHREPADGEPRWVPTAVPDALLAGEALPPAVSAVTVDAPPADPLTATSDGVWLDLRVTPAGAAAPVDLTEHLAISDPPATAETPTATATVTATATATPTPSATPGPAVAAKLDGRWCDATTVCDHRLGFSFARGARGYRSLAGPATDAARFGTREISSPVDAGVAADARAREAVRQGGYAQLAGDAFAPRDGIGDDGSSTTQAIAFTADGTTGFTGGTAAFGAATAARPPTVADAPLPPLGDAIVAAAASPNGDGRIFAMSRQGGALLYTPDRGWLYPETALTPTQAHGRFTALRAVAWPRRNLMVGVGSAGALVTSLRDPLPFDLSEGSGDPRGQIVPYEGLPVEATLLAVACNATDPVECTAVGRNGLIVRGDGTRWHVEQLPGEAPATTDITSVAYDGRTPLAATTAGLYRGEGDGRWTRDDALGAALEASGRPPAVVRVATEPGGGAVVDGRFERDAPTAPWRPTSAPLALHPVAIAAFRDGGQVRTLVSAAATAPPLPVPVEPDDGDRDPPTGPEGPRHDPVPLDASPVDAVVLRETADGWVDLDGTSYQQSGGRDLPRTTSNTRAFVLDQDGTGLALGGLSGVETNPREPDPVAAFATARRFDHGGPAPAPPPAFEPAETGTMPGDAVRLAIGGHATCLDRCTGGSGQGLTPDVHVGAAITRIKSMVAAGDGPAALLFGGGRASRGGEALDEGGARRYRELTQGTGVPTYVLPGPGDTAGGGDAAFARGFADAAAPQGTGAAAEGIDAAAVPQPASPPGARRVFAFDVRAAAGTVRVVAIDNASGSLAGGPDGPQAQWLRDVMAAARERSIPVVVVGSASLDGAQHMPRADDADLELALLAGHASAYVATAGVDDPLDPHFGGVMSRTEVTSAGAGAPLAVFQSSTLGYAPPRSIDELDEESFDESEVTRQTSAALLMLDVAVGRIDAGTGVAPVTAMAEPLVEDVALDASQRTFPVGFAQPIGVTGSDPAQLRFLRRDAESGALVPASAYTGVFLPLDQCVLWSATCTSTVPTDIAFGTSNPRVARFVAARRGADSDGPRRPEIILDASGHVVDDPRGVFCPLTAGAVDVTVTTSGRRITTPIQVIELSLLDLPSEIKITPIAPGTCGFPDFTVTKKAEKPVAAAPENPAAPQRPAPLPIIPPPAQPHAPAPVHHAPPAPAPVPPPPSVPEAPALVPPPPVPVTQTPIDVRPPVAPAGKPPAPVAPPAPPAGLSVQSAPAAQVGTFQATQAQQQRRREHAFEADSAAVAYAHPPSPLPWELLGAGAALALAIAGGSLAGRARRRVPALARATVGPTRVTRRR